MVNDYNYKKNKALGMPIGTASNRLRKSIMFDFVKKLGLDKCFRCGKPIESVEKFSIEHKEAWLGSENPIKSFFDLNNIAFSHHSCNSASKKMPSNTNWATGERVGSSKLTNDKVVKIRHLYSKGGNQYHLAKQFGVDQSVISLIVNNKLWRTSGKSSNR